MGRKQQGADRNSQEFVFFFLKIHMKLKGKMANLKTSTAESNIKRTQSKIMLQK